MVVTSQPRFNYIYLRLVSTMTIHRQLFEFAVKLEYVMTTQDITLKYEVYYEYYLSVSTDWCSRHSVKSYPCLTAN